MYRTTMLRMSKIKFKGAPPRCSTLSKFQDQKPRSSWYIRDQVGSFHSSVAYVLKGPLCHISDDLLPRTFRHFYQFCSSKLKATFFFPCNLGVCILQLKKCALAPMASTCVVSHVITYIYKRFFATQEFPLS